MTDQAGIQSVLRQACGQAEVRPSRAPGGELFADIPVSCLAGTIEALGRTYGPVHLSAITALSADEAFEIIYHLWIGGGLSLRTRCPAEKRSVPSLADILPAADWYEREIHDLWGIAFEGDPHPRPLLLPEDWEGPPPMLEDEDDQCQ